MNPLLPGSRIRGLLVGAAAFAALLVASQLMPGSGGGGSKGTPPGILFLGLVYGLLSALVAAGIILIYRTTRIINFAQAAMGATGGVFTYNLVIAKTTRFPYLAAFAVGLVVSALLGMIVELAFVRRFFNAPRLVLTVVTIAVVPALGLLSGFVGALPIFGDPQTRDPEELFGSARVTLPFENFQFHIGKLSLPFGFPEIFSLGMSLLALVGLAVFFRYTRAGVAVRAAAENTDRAMLLGINVKGLSTVVWGLTGLLSGVGVILSATVAESFQAVASNNPAAVIAALAAAVVGRMRSLPVAVATATGLEVLRQAISWSFQDQLALFDALLFLLILGGLMIQRKELQRSEEGEASSWKASEEIRPIPKEMLEVGGVRLWRVVLVVLGLIFVLVFPWATSTGTTNRAGYTAILGIAIVSLVVLTGWAGQVSLGQFALVGIGAILGGAATSRMGISFWLALPLGAALTAVVAVLIGLPALRIKGLFLAVTTFAFAFAVESNVFNPKYFGWILPDRVDRPALFFFDFDDERSMYYLSVIAFVLAVVAVTTLRRSRPGRVLIALRENESNVQAFGVNLVRTRLAAFALSGSLCGLAGVLLAHHQRAVTKANFPAGDSLQVFIFAVIGGIGSVAGAILGAAYYAMSQLLAGNALAALIIGPAGLLILLYVAPGGLTSLVFGLRDGVLRIIAQRRRMVVPSLFADIDPAALELQLAPLAEPLPNAGLAAIGFRHRYRTDSRLYQDRGKLAATRGRRSPDYQRAFGGGVGGMEAALPEKVPARAAPEHAEPTTPRKEPEA